MKVLMINGPYKGQWKVIPDGLKSGDSFVLMDPAGFVLNEQADPYEELRLTSYTLFDDVFQLFGKRVRVTMGMTGGASAWGQDAFEALFSRDVIQNGRQDW